MLKTDPMMTPTRSEKGGGATQNHCIPRTKDQTIHAEWLAIPSVVVDPVPAVLPAEVTKTICDLI